MAQPTPQPKVDDYVFLIGRPPIGEFLGFMRMMAANGHLADQGQLTQEWRKANDHVMHLEKSEAGMADKPAVQPLPAEMHQFQQKVLDDPVFKHAFQYVPTELVMVELDTLVVYQKFINLGFVRQLKSKLGAKPTPELIFRTALSVDFSPPNVQLMQTGPNSFTFLSPSTDFRFLKPELFGADKLINIIQSDRPVAMLGLVLGYGSNYLNAVQIEDRIILNNGSHRAYALRDLGIRNAPCLLQHISRRDELEVTGPPEILQNPDRYLKTPRPPLLKDYFDNLLTKVVPVPRKNRLVRVSFGVESTDIPAS